MITIEESFSIIKELLGAEYLLQVARSPEGRRWAAGAAVRGEK
jgi:hypothetical protein